MVTSRIANGVGKAGLPKAGLMSRLSHLIIVQVVFVFAALFLLIFTPQSDVSVEVNGLQHKAAFAELARGVAAQIARWEPDQVGKEASGALIELFGTDPSLKFAAVYCQDANGSTPLFEFSQGTTPEEEPLWDESELPAITVGPTTGTGAKSWPTFPLVLDEKDVVFCGPVTFADGSSGLFVGMFAHNLFVSDRSALGYALLLLFLFAALVALLTVYLIHRNFTRPFRRMVHGFEKTSDGELYYLMENSGEEELSRLAMVFNKLSRNLQSREQQLVRYDARLRDTSDSLEKSQVLLSAVIENSPVGVITTDPEGKILLFNRKAATLFGCTEEKGIGRPIEDLFLSDVRERARTHEGEADECGLEAVGRRCDGSQFAAFLITSTLRNEQNGTTGYVYIVRDISQSKDFQQMMIRLDRYYTKGEMAGDIAHEINNYLSILLGNVELVPLLIKKGNMERLDQKLELMHGTVDKIARLTDGLLDTSRDEIRFDRCDINQLVNGVVAFLKPQNKFDNTEVVTDLSPEIPLVEVDASMMHQVLVNLIYNAGEAVCEQDGERRIRIGTRIVPSAGTDKPILEIVVEDNGPGVPGAKLPMVFKKRFTTKPRGHGIGLISCRKIVEAHGGAISYAYESGARFTVTVPVDQGRVQSPADVPAADAESHVPANF